MEAEPVAGTAARDAVQGTVAAATTKDQVQINQDLISISTPQAEQRKT